ncbi:phosphoribosylamine--glycine ligase [Nosocomiicoccus ampullae]|uniref:Phosphoribosylamine--glycine ligase n=1 Tax=Nosocomiicoccus ampullae TaxID=489910 RepID=A0A9Q2HFL8_9STAP|nr:phosphoribosylamine--glycine ligase [Nosocomiicoccus ampullae]MBB5175662.1 phosphoribosylamine--glycine ligase [Nosocomiicoccus ampullae]QYA47057.1 phosphoribosylamine--glycine ligase [Nosocomiicoccus ampullae]
MNTLVIGSGGREHAIVRALNRSEKVNEVFALPGNDGMTEATLVEGIPVSEFDQIGEFCKENDIEWVVVGPEDPLSEGIVDTLEDKFKLNVFGPRKKEAQMESSKSFTKHLMKKYDIPTASYEVFTDKEQAKSYLENGNFPAVIKKDGLAAGKGVIIAQDLNEALNALDELMETDGEVVIEEFLDGDEFSLMVLVNGDTFTPFNIIAQDHKRAFDNDEGPNTGGMGAYAPVDYISENIIEEAVEKIVRPTVNAMVEEGLNYFGVLYLGAIITTDGVKTIEYNARFGDPEAQILLDLLETDFIDMLEGMKRKEPLALNFREEYVVGVILASEGYPGDYEKAKEIVIKKDLMKGIYVSALKHLENDIYESNGGRVLLAVGRGNTIEDAKNQAYRTLNEVKYDEKDFFYRKDIAYKA